MGADVLGLSTDSIASHEQFAAKLSLPYPLLSDSDAAVCKAYGVYKEKNMYGKKYMGIERTTVVIDPRGAIQRVYPKVKVEGHARMVLDDLRSHVAH